MEKIIRSRILERLPYELRLELDLLSRRRDIVICEEMQEEILKLFRKYKIDGIVPLGPGTNRYAMKLDGWVIKVATNHDGKIDNLKEFKMAKRLLPYVTKIYEVSENGTLLVAEYVQPFSDYAEMVSHADQIREILQNLSSMYLIGDVGINPKNYANWGMRVGYDEPVCLDFAYVYSVSSQLFLCRECNSGSILVPDRDFTYLYCPAPGCGKRYLFEEIRRRIGNDLHAHEIGDLSEEGYKIKKSGLPIVLNPKISQYIEAPLEDEKPKEEEPDEFEEDEYMNIYELANQRAMYNKKAAVKIIPGDAKPPRKVVQAEVCSKEDLPVDMDPSKIIQIVTETAAELRAQKNPKPAPVEEEVEDEVYAPEVAFEADMEDPDGCEMEEPEEEEAMDEPMEEEVEDEPAPARVVEAEVIPVPTMEPSPTEVNTGMIWETSSHELNQEEEEEEYPKSSMTKEKLFEIYPELANYKLHKSFRQRVAQNISNLANRMGQSLQDMDLMNRMRDDISDKNMTAEAFYRGIQNAIYKSMIQFLHFMERDHGAPIPPSDLYAPEYLPTMVFLDRYWRNPSIRDTKENPASTMAIYYKVYADKNINGIQYEWLDYLYARIAYKMPSISKHGRTVIADAIGGLWCMDPIDVMQHGFIAAGQKEIPVVKEEEPAVEEPVAEAPSAVEEVEETSTVMEDAPAVEIPEISHIAHPQPVPSDELEEDEEESDEEADDEEWVDDLDPIQIRIIEGYQGWYKVFLIGEDVDERTCIPLYISKEVLRSCRSDAKELEHSWDWLRFFAPDMIFTTSDANNWPTVMPEPNTLVRMIHLGSKGDQMYMGMYHFAGTFLWDVENEIWTPASKQVAQDWIRLINAYVIKTGMVNQTGAMISYLVQTSDICTEDDVYEVLKDEEDENEFLSNAEQRAFMEALQSGLLDGDSGIAHDVESDEDEGPEGEDDADESTEESGDDTSADQEDETSEDPAEVSPKEVVADPPKTKKMTVLPQYRRPQGSN